MNYSAWRWAALGSMSLGMAMLYMNTTMVTQALPMLSTSLNASTVESEWLIAAYNLAFLAVLLPGGALGDAWGHRRALLAGIAAFGVCAIVSVFVSTPLGLILTRCGMGLGASVFTPMSLALLPQLFRDLHGRAVATSIWTISGALGAPLGPLAGGVIIDLLGWQGMFILDACVCLVVLTACWRFIPADTRTRREPLAWMQAGTSACAFAAITWGLVVASSGWLHVRVWVLLGAGAALLTLFIWQERRCTLKLTDLGLLSRLHFRRAAFCMGLVNLILFGILYVTPTYFQTVLGYSATTSGLLLMPSIMTALVGSLLVSSLARHPYRRAFILPGALLVVAVGCAIASKTTATSPIAMVVGLLIAGFGLGAGQSFGFTAAMEEVSEEKRASGAALLNTIRQLGALLGTALIGSLMSTIYHHAAPSEANGIDAAGYVVGLAWVVAGCAAAAAATGLAQLWGTRRIR